MSAESRLRLPYLAPDRRILLPKCVARGTPAFCGFEDDHSTRNKSGPRPVYLRKKPPLFEHFVVLTDLLGGKFVRFGLRMEQILGVNDWIIRSDT